MSWYGESQFQVPDTLLVCGSKTERQTFCDATSKIFAIIEQEEVDLASQILIHQSLKPDQPKTTAEWLAGIETETLSREEKAAWSKLSALLSYTTRPYVVVDQLRQIDRGGRARKTYDKYRFLSRDDKKVSYTAVLNLADPADCLDPYKDWLNPSLGNFPLNTTITENKTDGIDAKWQWVIARSADCFDKLDKGSSLMEVGVQSTNRPPHRLGNAMKDWRGELRKTSELIVVGHRDERERLKAAARKDYNAFLNLKRPALTSDPKADEDSLDQMCWSSIETRRDEAGEVCVPLPTILRLERLLKQCSISGKDRLALYEDIAFSEVRGTNMQSYEINLPQIGSENAPLSTLLLDFGGESEPCWAIYRKISDDTHRTTKYDRIIADSNLIQDESGGLRFRRKVHDRELDLEFKRYLSQGPTVELENTNDPLVTVRDFAVGQKSYGTR